MKPEIVLFGNVLLDTAVKIDSVEILTRYGLEKDGQGEISAETLKEIFDEVSSSPSLQCNPGGSALNTCRILSTIRPEGGTLFFGAVGSDKTAEILREILERKGVAFNFQVIPNTPTGQAICLVYEDERSLYANIGASALFAKNFLESIEQKAQFLGSNRTLQIFYIEGYFLPHRTEVCKYIAESYICDSRLLALNLSAPYIVRENLSIIKYLIEKSTLIFGNQREFNALKDVYQKLAIKNVIEELMANSNKKIFVITNGPNDVVTFSKMANGDDIEENNYPVDKIPMAEVVDTTGAGDSFVAGFLDSYLRLRSIAECVASGCCVARKVVMLHGCNLPDT